MRGQVSTRRTVFLAISLLAQCFTISDLVSISSGERVAAAHVVARSSICLSWFNSNSRPQIRYTSDSHFTRIPSHNFCSNPALFKPMLFLCSEFYYIQMEKYARQAIADGVASADDIIVTTDSELYRVLNLHYNRNNQLEVPEGFRLTVQVTFTPSTLTPPCARKQHKDNRMIELM